MSRHNTRPVVRNSTFTLQSASSKLLAAQDFGLANVEYKKVQPCRISFAATRLIEESDPEILPSHAWLYGHCRLTARAPVTDAGISDPFRD